MAMEVPGHHELGRIVALTMVALVHDDRRNERETTMRSHPEKAHCQWHSLRHWRNNRTGGNNTRGRLLSLGTFSVSLFSFLSPFRVSLSPSLTFLGAGRRGDIAFPVSGRLRWETLCRRYQFCFLLSFSVICDL